MVCRGDDTLLFHPVNKGCRAIVTDSQTTLNITGRGFLVVLNNCKPLGHKALHHCFRRQTHHCQTQLCLRLFFVQLAFGHFLNIFRLTLLFQKLDNGFDLLILNIRGMNTIRALPGRHIKAYRPFPAAARFPCSPKIVRLSILEVT